jgi:hypothetical protein
MALKNPNLKKLGNSSINSNTGDINSHNSGHTQACLVQPATALPYPAPFAGDKVEPFSAWQQRWQQYQQSIQITQKFSQDSE